jgi:hypothetical protein
MTNAQSSTSTKDDGIIVFVKYPEPGTVKSRLSAEVGATHAIHFYQCFVADLLATLKPLDVPIVISYSPEEYAKKISAWLGESYIFLPATGDTFGKRLRNSFENAFANGFQRIILLSSDNPDVPKEYIIEALQTLQSNDVVIGPCEDGGYYLLGFTVKGFLPAVFDDIPWSTSEVFPQTLKKLQQGNRSVHILPQWYDIDTYADLLKFSNRNKKTQGIAEQTKAAISLYKKKEKMAEIGTNKKYQEILSVVVPILTRTPQLSVVREHIRKATTPIEIILAVDTQAKNDVAAESPNEKIVLITKKGRGVALAEGARQATGDIIVFLHADTILPTDWDLAIRRSLEEKNVIGGGFSLRFDEDNTYLNILIFLSNILYFCFGELWGDRALFVRTSVLKEHIEEIDQMFMEDVQLSKLMKRNGKIVLLKEPVITSPSTFHKQGVFRTTIRILISRLWYEVGGNPEKIYEYYYNIR